MIRARARLVGSERGRLDVAAPVGRRAGRCWLWAVACAVWLLAVGCGPAAVIGWPWPCGLWLAPAGWWAVVGCIAGLLAGSCAPALCLCWWRLSACALSGGYGGRIYQAPRRLYRARKTPPGAAGRLPGGLFSPSPRRGARGRRRSCHGPPVLPSAGPPVGGPPWCFCRFLPPVCRCAGAARRHGPPHGKRRRKRAGFSRPVCRTSPAAGPGPGRAPAPRLPPGRSRQAAELEKIPSENSGGIFYAPGLSLASWYINAPL